MQTLLRDPVPAVWTVVSVDPDRLIELGHRLKQHAMDFARSGETLTAPLTESILLVYEPPAEMTKPHVSYGAPAVLSFGGEEVQ